MNPTDMTTIRQVTFEKVRMGLSKNFGHNMLESMDMRQTTDIMSRDLINQIEFDILSNKMIDDKYTFKTTFRYPASWFQHLKQDKFPKWFIKKYPVKYKYENREKSVKFTRYATYPKANLAIQSERDLYIKLGSFETIRDVLYEC